MRVLLAAMFSVVIASAAAGATQQLGCALYLNTNKAYKVQITLIPGTELNLSTGGLSYNALATYAVIFWDDGQATVIELDMFFGSLNEIGSYGSDQNGRRWYVSSRTAFCWSVGN
jgi:hypothetical protein